MQDSSDSFSDMVDQFNKEAPYAIEWDQICNLLIFLNEGCVLRYHDPPRRPEIRDKATGRFKTSIGHFLFRIMKRIGYVVQVDPLSWEAGSEQIFVGTEKGKHFLKVREENSRADGLEKFYTLFDNREGGQQEVYLYAGVSDPRCEEIVLDPKKPILIDKGNSQLRFSSSRTVFGFAFFHPSNIGMSLEEARTIIDELRGNPPGNISPVI